MKIEIQISDDLYTRYELQARAGSRNVKLELADRLARFIDAALPDRVLLVRKKERQELEALLGQVSLQSDSDLVERVKRLAALSIGEVKLQFTPAQLTEMKRRAEKNKRTFQEELAVSVRSVQSLVFDRV
jgi:hypothetical protein